MGVLGRVTSGAPPASPPIHGRDTRSPSPITRGPVDVVAIAVFANRRHHNGNVCVFSEEMSLRSPTSRCGFLSPFLLLDSVALVCRNHHRAGRDQHVPILVWNCARHENLGEARIRARHFARIVSSGNDQVVNPFSDALDPLSRDAAAVAHYPTENPPSRQIASSRRPWPYRYSRGRARRLRRL